MGVTMAMRRTYQTVERNSEKTTNTGFRSGKDKSNKEILLDALGANLSLLHSARTERQARGECRATVTFPYWDRHTQTLEPGTFCQGCTYHWEEGKANDWRCMNTTFHPHPPSREAYFRAFLEAELPQHFLHCNFTNLAERDGFKDRLRVHGIRGAVANKVDPKASEATRGQALDHQNHDTYLKYQSALKSLDVQALFYDLEPDYECRDMEQSMAHHRDPNAPRHLNAAGLAAFERDEEIVALTRRL